MTENEAKDILNEIMELDDSMAQYNLMYMKAMEVAIKALEEVQRYRQIGTPEELQDMKNNYFEALSDWRQYRKIGTLEECRAAVEKQKPKKPRPIDYERYVEVIENADFLRGTCWCPNCSHAVKCGSFCQNCGQKLDWSGEE